MWETWVRSWVGKIPWRRERLPTPVSLGFPGGSAGKESTCNTGELGWILSWEDTLEKGMAIHFSILAWRIPWTVWSMGSERVGQDWATFTFHFSLSGGSVVKNLPASARDMGSIPGPGTKMPHAAEQLSLHAAASEFTCPKVHALQQEKPRQWEARATQLSRSL